ncbi:MAG: helical backbone metal receptor [Saprospiraceae bacterium]|nr:helical backbone metal receptor [Saprospiraceae bacterium]
MQKKDDLGNLLILPSKINKIISLCPSVTETLFALGLRKKIVGRTRYCIHPENEVSQIPTIGGVLDVSIEKIREINPDIIFAVKQENSKENIKKVTAEFPVYVFDVDDIQSSLNMIATIGCLCDALNLSVNLLSAILNKIDGIKTISKTNTFIYLVWKNPFMAAGEKTYISKLLERFDFVNCIDNYSKTYVNFNINDLIIHDADYVFLPSEPYKFTETDKQDIQKYFPNSKVLLVDGEMFSWYGSRLVKAVDYISKNILFPSK